MEWGIWLNKREWPRKPSGYAWIMDAAERISRRVFPEKWVGIEFAFEPALLAEVPSDPSNGELLPCHYPSVWLWAEGAIAPSDPAFVAVPSIDQWRTAFERWRYSFEHGEELLARKRLACIFLGQAAERGDLLVHARNEATGAMVPITREQWNCDYGALFARLSRGRINLVHPMVPEPARQRDRQLWLARMTSWLFVSEENLDAFLSGKLAWNVDEEAVNREPKDEQTPSRGWGIADARIVERMRKLVVSGDCPSPTAAAEKLLAEIKGSGTPESRVRRLQRAYDKKYRPA